MSKVDDYRRQLRRLKRWRPFLMRASGLPGPRGNLELAAAVALEASREQIEELLSIPPVDAPENSPEVFLVFCGVVSLGKLVAAGDHTQLRRLRTHASDPRWRIREAVAMALQTAGDADIGLALETAKEWSRGNWYEKRAAAAALAEPRLLRTKEIARATLAILDDITASITRATDRSSDSFRALRQGMGYCWSVAVAAHPAAGKPLIERWLQAEDRDVRWLLKENLKKNRLVRADPRWVRACLRKLMA